MKLHTGLRVYCKTVRVVWTVDGAQEEQDLLSFIDIGYNKHIKESKPVREENQNENNCETASAFQTCCGCSMFFDVFLTSSLHCKKVEFDHQNWV